MIYATTRAEHLASQNSMARLILRCAIFGYGSESCGEGIRRKVRGLARLVTVLTAADMQSYSLRPDLLDFCGGSPVR